MGPNPEWQLLNTGHHLSTLTTSQLPKLRPVCLSLAVGAARRLTIAVFFLKLLWHQQSRFKTRLPDWTYTSIYCLQSLPKGEDCRQRWHWPPDTTNDSRDTKSCGYLRQKALGEVFQSGNYSYKASVSEVNTVLGLPTFNKTQDPVPQLLFCSSSNYSFIIWNGQDCRS